MGQRHEPTLLGIAILALIASTAAKDPQQGSSNYSDYMSSDGSVGTVTAVGEAECEKSLSARAGAWFCGKNQVGDQKSHPGQESGHATQSGEIQQPEGATQPQTDCDHLGCWTRYSDFRSDFSGTGWYGYDDEVLGEVVWFYNIRLNGAQSSTSPIWFRSTRGVSNLIFVGDRLYTSAKYPGGNPVNDGDEYEQRWVGSVGADQTAYWQGGYTSYENTTQYASIVHNVTWTDPSSEYPGRWYFYAKSIVAERRVDDYAILYEFLSEENLPDDPAGAGWKPD